MDVMVQSFQSHRDRLLLISALNVWKENLCVIHKLEQVADVKYEQHERSFLTSIFQFMKHHYYNMDNQALYIQQERQAVIFYSHQLLRIIFLIWRSRYDTVYKQHIQRAKTHYEQQLQNKTFCQWEDLTCSSMKYQHLMNIRYIRLSIALRSYQHALLSNTFSIWRAATYGKTYRENNHHNANNHQLYGEGQQVVTRLSSMRQLYSLLNYSTDHHHHDHNVSYSHHHRPISISSSSITTHQDLQREGHISTISSPEPDSETSRSSTESDEHMHINISTPTQQQTDVETEVKPNHSPCFPRVLLEDL